MAYVSRVWWVPQTRRPSRGRPRTNGARREPHGPGRAVETLPRLGTQVTSLSSDAPHLCGHPDARDQPRKFRGPLL